VTTCETCEKPLATSNKRARFCGGACRMKAARSKTATVTAIRVLGTTAGVGTVQTAVTAELELAGRLSSALGQASLALARRIDSGEDNGSALAACARQLALTLESATRGAKFADDPLDELEAWRDRIASKTD
jgi:hypothetical protein